MRYEHKGRTFRIRFEHIPPQEGRVCRFHRHLVKALTRCVIELQTTAGPEDTYTRWMPLAEGRAACSYSDQYVKETGRRIALTRAIEGWDREARTRVWKAYWKAKGVE